MELPIRRFDQVIRQHDHFFKCNTPVLGCQEKRTIQFHELDNSFEKRLRIEVSMNKNSTEKLVQSFTRNALVLFVSVYITAMSGIFPFLY